MKRHGFLLLFISFSFLLNAQIGGRYAFESVSLPLNARLTALGGFLPGVQDEDVALAFQNPALSNKAMDWQLSVNHNIHFSGISHGNVLFGKSLDSLCVQAHFGIAYVDYGSFQAANVFGDVQGEFSAGELSVIAGASRRMNERITAGLNLKFLSSNYESYSALGLGADFGFFYQKPGSNSSWSVVMKNIGSEIKSVSGDRRALPFDLQLAYTQRLEHLPFRFSIIGRQLQQWYIRYDDPDRDVRVNFVGEVEEVSGFGKAVDNLFRHIIVNGEFLIGKNEQFRLRLAYNHLRRQEMRLNNFRSLAGFSFGFGFNIKKLRFDYGLGYYHLAGATNHLSLRLDMDSIFNKI